MFADHRQLVFGKGQPTYDVLYKIIGDDRGHVPLQFPQNHQFPVLKDIEDDKENVSVYWQNLLSQRVKWHNAMSLLAMTKIPVSLYSQRKWLSNIFSLYLSSLYLIICVPSHSLHPLCSYCRHVTGFALLKHPANETASPFLPVTSLKQLR